MLTEPLVLTNAVYAADFIKGISIEKDGIRLHFADGMNALFALDPAKHESAADGQRIKRIYDKLQRAFTLAHYKRQLAEFERLTNEGQIAEGDEFRRPTMPDTDIDF